jgi:hypothetical protein
LERFPRFGPEIGKLPDGAELRFLIGPWPWLIVIYPIHRERGSNRRCLDRRRARREFDDQPREPALNTEIPRPID